MDINYESFSLSSRSGRFLPYFPPLSPEPPALQSSEISRTSRPTHSVLGSTQSMFDFSSPQLVDYSIFDTLVDVSVGTLPPRPTTSRALAQGRVPRPRNAFMLFRSAFHRERRLLKSVEKDHRHISRIIGLCWAELSEAEKDVWRQKAELEKQQHALAYPDYRFKPTPRTKQPVKRNVNRNSDKEIERCRKIAKLIQTGKSGEELTHAVKRMDDEMPSTSLGGSMASDECEEKMRKRQAISDRTLASVPSHPMGPQFASTQQQPTRYMSIDEHPRPPFRSPLLPLSALPQTSSKRPHLTAAPEMQQPATTNNQLGSLDSSCIAPPYSNLEYPSRQVDQGTKYLHQWPSYQSCEWPGKYFPSFVTYGPDSTHHSHYSVMSVMESTQAVFTPGNQFVPNSIDWNLYDRTSVLTDGTASTSSTYES
ncbi:hypothetical protein AGABI2DRAFT_176060 [Agaricus bisporus var. bisporus H97]|uniref:hypothetical protein n=1 Tax=Agaricus bisporus var. bisporus (strain H97 / ATCC MYA-4626 / FGSC 10389) TaxID=936046 RepID=UPI00029F53E8|nr:hypothetical protein AGABI2DRAFT_176060 [Agaricus bisporus var. bisporus H97]EKV51568.1 hypothetical protein AGABI2DRAFT_176060 [Agaricus bisporus var. bisporus H97]